MLQELEKKSVEETMDMGLSVLSEITVFNKYAKFLPKESRRETWQEIVDRNKNMHLKKFPQLTSEIEEAYKLVYDKKVLPSMRSMQFAGKPIDVNPTRIFNCSFLPIDDYRAFGETMFLLLSGTGVGYSVQKHHIEKLPELKKPSISKTKRFLVGDSVEGWADAIKALMKSYFMGGSTIRFDYSDIRPKGAMLVTAGGKAPGPDPLKNCINQIVSILSKREDGDKLSSVEVHDIICHIADAVLAGGIRRAALIALFSADDENMLKSKSNFTVENWKYALEVGPVDSQGEPVEVYAKHIDDLGNIYYDLEVTVNEPCYGKSTKTLYWVSESDIQKYLTITSSNIPNGSTLPWYYFQPQRGRANNSAALLRHKLKKSFFMELWKKVEESGSGEPGIYLTNDKDWGTNPCVEIALRPFQFCLTGDTPILTAFGYRTIKELHEEFKSNHIPLISSYNSDKATVNDVATFETFKSQIFPIGKKKVYEISLSRGGKIKATSNHSFLTQDGYVKVRDLDLSYHQLYMAQDNNQVMKIAKGIEGFNEFDFLGWLIGDGWYTNNPNQLKNVYENLGLVFGSEADTFAKEKIIPVFETLLQEAVDSGITRVKGFSLKENIDKNNVTTFTTWSTKARYIGNKFGLTPGTAKDKTLPRIFWETSMENRARVLSALFSADGGVQNSHGNKVVRLALSNPVMAEQVQLALSEFGIVSKVTVSERKNSTRCNTEVQVVVSGKINLLNYKNNIGFRLHPTKEIKLDELLGSYTRLNSTHTNTFEIEAITYVGREEVYDITVEESHNFIANGIITHNCNLTEINASNITSQEDFNERARVASFIGTLQAAYTDFHYLRPIWKKTTEKDALVGVSMTGIASMKIFKYSIEEAVEVVKNTNENLAKQLGINSAARLTCCKPAGTTSLVLGTSSGIHAWHNDYYLRRMRIGKNEALYTYLSIYHPELLEDDIFRSYDTACIVVPQKAPEGAVLRTESAFDLLERVKEVSTRWVANGFRNGQNGHNVSATITVKKDEWKAVGEWMWENRETYNGLSVLPHNEHSYKQAPFEDCTKEEYENKIKSLHSVNLKNVVEMGDTTNLAGELACASGNCEIQ